MIAKHVSSDTQALPRSTSEAEFLAQQATDAKLALTETLRQMLDIRTYAREHPWATAGSACLAGLVVAQVTRGGGKSQVVDGRAPRSARKGLTSSLLTTVVSEAVKFLVPAIFTGAVLAKTEDVLEETASRSPDPQR